MDCLGFPVSAVMQARVSCWGSHRFLIVSVGFRRISGGFSVGFLLFPIGFPLVSRGFPMASCWLPMIPIGFPKVSCGFLWGLLGCLKVFSHGVQLVLGVLLQYGFSWVSCGFLRVFVGFPAGFLCCPLVSVRFPDETQPRQCHLNSRQSPQQAQAKFKNMKFQGPVSGAIFGPKNGSKTAVAELGLHSSSLFKGNRIS